MMARTRGTNVACAEADRPGTSTRSRPVEADPAVLDLARRQVVARCCSVSRIALQFGGVYASVLVADAQRDVGNALGARDLAGVPERRSEP